MTGSRFAAVLLLASTCAFPQRLYNEARDRQAAEALALSQQLLSGQVWEKALSNLEELYRLRQQMVFDSTQSLLKSEYASWETWADVQATFDRLPAPPPPPNAEARQRLLAGLKASRQAAEAELDQLRASLLANRTEEQIRMVGLWMERIGAAKPLFDSILKLEQGAAGSQVNREAATAARKSLDELAALYQGFRAEVPAGSAGTIFLEGRVRLLELEQSHLLRLAAISQRLQDESARAITLRTRSQALLTPVLAKYGDSRIAESFTKARTENPDLLETMVSALYHVAAYAARADLPRRLANHRESLELRAQAIRRDAANAAVYEKTILNGVQRLSAYHKGGIKAQNLAALIQALATAGVIPAILTR
jgi:hypothetical protein